MKGIVVKIEKNKGIVLTSKGNFVESRIQDCFEIGKEVRVKPFKSSFQTRKVLALSLSLLLAFSFAIAGYAYYTPSSYVSVDINPSVELVSNVFDRVISVQGRNLDGVALVNGLAIRNMKIEDAVVAIIDEAVIDGYIDGETIDTDVLVSVASLKNENKGQDIAENINNSISVSNNMAQGNGVVKVENKEKYDEAKELGVSLGRLTIVKKAIAADETLNEEDLYSTSIKELNEIIREAKDDKGDNQGNSNKPEEPKGTEEDNGNGNEDKPGENNKPEIDNGSVNSDPGKGNQQEDINNDGANIQNDPGMNNSNTDKGSDSAEPEKGNQAENNNIEENDTQGNKNNLVPSSNMNEGNTNKPSNGK